MQASLFRDEPLAAVRPFRSQLLKWVGNKQRFAHDIASFFPCSFSTYLEPFLGSGAVLGTLAPQKAVASDVFPPLMQIWKALQSDPERLKDEYRKRWERMMADGKVKVYEEIKASYNARPNGHDLLFLCRTCYGGVVRFRKTDGYMSTPCGPHRPVAPESLAKRVDEWNRRTSGTRFIEADFRETLGMAGEGDLVYCDPPYTHSQSILYGAQSFALSDLFEAIAACKKRGARVALSIDGTKKSGSVLCDLSIPEGLFERQVFVNCGRSMLRRFQMNGKTLEGESVADRLLLTYTERALR